MSVGRERLLSGLKEIQKNGYRMDSVQKRQEYTALMLGNIGDPDPELRDELIYSALCEWIDTFDYFGEEELKSMLSVLMDKNHLFRDIGSDGTNSVFTRSFSALGVALVLGRHSKQAVYSAGEFDGIKEKAILYYTSEKDLRGYTPESGWAHSAAHGADVMEKLAGCRECGADTAKEILYAFKKLIYNGKYIFRDEEDERIGRAVFRIIKRNLVPANDILKWLEDLCECAEWEWDLKQYASRVNAKNMLRCVYFKLMHWDPSSPFAGPVFKAEEKLNRFLTFDKELMEK